MMSVYLQLAIMHSIITGIMAIKIKTMKSWETTITFFACVCGFILGLPMATEVGNNYINVIGFVFFKLLMANNWSLREILAILMLLLFFLQLGIFVVYFMDFCVGGGWWIVLLYLIELMAVFMVRGRPYSGETVVAELFKKAGPAYQNIAAPIL